LQSWEGQTNEKTQSHPKNKRIVESVSDFRYCTVMLIESCARLSPSAMW